MAVGQSSPSSCHGPRRDNDDYDHDTKSACQGATTSNSAGNGHHNINIDAMEAAQMYARNRSFGSRNDLDDSIGAFEELPRDKADSAWFHIDREYKNKNLEKLFGQFQRKLQRGNISLFVVIQIILAISHCSILIGWTSATDAIIDVVIMGVLNAVLFPILALVFRAGSYKENPILSIYYSCSIVALLIIGDVVPAMYHSKNDEKASYKPVYQTHTLIACYFFLPLPRTLSAVILGVMASTCYITSSLFITYRNDFFYEQKILTDLNYHVCINMLGCYFRFMNQMMIKRSFLDRNKCVLSTLRLNYEKDQEEQLTRSILPRHFAHQITNCFVEKSVPQMEETRPSLTSITIKNMFMEVHKNVSILYADVVNFSGLTVRMPVQKLVETLNRLFGSFDDASELRKVLRIKFLGDCYYCVAGVPQPDPRHAANCVDLGLDMIDIIAGLGAGVRRECGVDIDMRIGVHSGEIMAGLLGAIKWQYDIWSRDVCVANKMEQTGRPGKVHVTARTLELLNRDNYCVEELDQTGNEILNKYGITKSYLITPVKQCEPEKYEYTSDTCRRRRPNRRNAYDQQAQRTNHFGQMIVRNYHLILKEANKEMEKAIDHMPLTKIEQWGKWERINPISLQFDKWQWELEYWREPDPLFKFSILLLAVLLPCVGPILLIRNNSNVQMSYTIFSYLGTFLFTLMLIPMSWMQFIWDYVLTKNNDEQNPSCVKPTNPVIKFFYRTSNEIVWKDSLRILVYFTLTTILTITTTYTFLYECQLLVQAESHKLNSSSPIEPTYAYKCVATPWQFTELCAITIITTFMFLRINFFIKLFSGAMIAIFYACNVWIYRSKLFQIPREAWNPILGAQLSHTLAIVYLIFSMHLIDRQTEYLNRLDYQWKRRLAQENREAFNVCRANKLLLLNILPNHVAEKFMGMDNTMLNRLYHEKHEYVAVMFATLTNLSIENVDTLSNYNKIICHFDLLLFNAMFQHRVEKIKLAGTTYMAASGLDNLRRNSGGENSPGKYSVLKVLTRFAAEIMKITENINSQVDGSYALRIGICTGEVTAGVVGVKKPLYDIWGDAVNMASRMDTTGVPGKIQVLKETADSLEKLGVKCHPRGETYVKPKGLLTTYFVGIDADGQLERCGASLLPDIVEEVDEDEEQDASKL
ncbi:adenylate cyclase type 7 [Trichogramma pretiosum]|uniref:adenylate cyclase type 7 n=1 Tax=Trichogramma pretiosum TaxID=7493 RepID=UPI000C71955F|nr:adenylate cyclase type 7 [Trichogramma pretiosum]